MYVYTNYPQDWITQQRYTDRAIILELLLSEKIAKLKHCIERSSQTVRLDPYYNLRFHISVGSGKGMSVPRYQGQVFQ